MNYTKELLDKCCVKCGADEGASPIPQEGEFNRAKQITDISGFSHGVGTCGLKQGACKLSLNIKAGMIEEALVEVLGCTGMTHSAAMASEILTGKTILEALNTDLVCDAINVAMREIFLALVYGRTQTSYSEGGLDVGAALEDLGRGLKSQVGTAYATQLKGPRYLEMTEGYVTKMALDEEQEIIGYEYVNIGQMMEDIRRGLQADKALAEATGVSGRYEEAVRYIDPRRE
ncbi:iron-sulfur cluster assembly scaffold protein [Dorea sp. D27]|uniref:iron-sulfur cluster assembly scaffold protein n=1 Tax=Dorea sp. D27 TaxID=658665 RepID=UPI0006733B7F|nr:nitrogen fixation protein NifU [Dorea sp. D27]KMZ53333.1 NifU-related domain containing protein [Dorea sp. D27]